MARPLQTVAQALGRRDLLVEAAAALRRADQVEPGDVEVAVPLVTILYRLGLDAEAQAVLQEAIARNGPHRDLLPPCL